MKTKILSFSLFFLLTLSLLLPQSVFAAKRGETCTTTGAIADCEAGLYCKDLGAGIKSCALQLENGDPSTCLGDYACKSGKCTNSLCVTPTVAPGATCAEGDKISNCGPGYFCDSSNVCISQLDIPEDCGGNYQCLSNNCVNTKCAAISGTTPPTTPGAVPSGATVGTDPSSASIGSSSSTGTPGTEPSSGTTGASPKTYSIPNPLGVNSINDLIAKLIKFFIGLSGSIALIIFIYGGLIWMTSGGEEAKIKKGRDAIKYSILGLGIIFTSYVLVKFIISAITSIG